MKACHPVSGGDQFTFSEPSKQVIQDRGEWGVLERQLYLRLPCSILLSPPAIPYGWGIKINYPHFDVALKKTMVPVRQTISVPLPPSPAPSRMAMTYFYLPRRSLSLSLSRSPFDGVILQRDSTVFPLVTFLCVCVFVVAASTCFSAHTRQRNIDRSNLKQQTPIPPTPPSSPKKPISRTLPGKTGVFGGLWGGEQAKESKIKELSTCKLICSN